MRRVVFNLKGGVGKTSIACNLAACLAAKGRKVLLLDIDSQANASQYLIGQDLPSLATVGDFFSSTLSFSLFKDSLSKTVYKTQWKNLSIIPASFKLQELQSQLESKHKIYKLVKCLDMLIPIFGFQDVIIDTPPALNFYSLSALIASESVLIPFDCDSFSTQAILKVLEVIEEVKEDHNPKLHVEGIIINNFMERATLPNDSVLSLAQQGLPILTPFLSSSVLMKESHVAGKPLIAYKPRHKLSLQFEELVTNLMKKEKNLFQFKKKIEETSKTRQKNHQESNV